MLMETLDAVVGGECSDKTGDISSPLQALHAELSRSSEEQDAEAAAASQASTLPDITTGPQRMPSMKRMPSVGRNVSAKMLKAGLKGKGKAQSGSASNAGLGSFKRTGSSMSLSMRSLTPTKPDKESAGAHE